MTRQKLKAPTFKLQGNPKSQIPNPKKIPKPKWEINGSMPGDVFGIWSLGFFWDLEFGIWDLEQWP